MIYRDFFKLKKALVIKLEIINCGQEAEPYLAVLWVPIYSVTGQLHERETPEPL